MKPCLLITGGAGYIGSHMVYAALENGYKVVVIDDLSAGFRDNLPADLDLYVGDVGDTDFIKKILVQYHPAAVIHFAGSVIVDESVRDPGRYYRNNTLASLTLIEACLEASVGQFIFSSTAAVYGLPDSGIASENTPLKPMSPYGHSKLMTERMLTDMSTNSTMTHAILRYFNVAGADPAGRTGQSAPTATHLIKVACQAALGKRPVIELFGSDYNTPDGTCRRDYIHVCDLVAAHLRVLNHIEKTSQNITLNCGNGRGYSVRDVINTVEKVAQTTITVRETARRPGDPETIIADPHRIQTELNWQANYDLTAMVASALAWESKCAF